MKEQKIVRIAAIALLASLGFLVAYYILKNIFAYLMPFIFAMLLAGLIEPFVGFLEKNLKLKRGVAVSIALGLIVSLLIFMIVFGTSRLFFELDRLLKNLPDFQEMMKKLEDFWSERNLLETFESWDLAPQFQRAIEEGLEAVYKSLESFLKGLFQALQDGARWAVKLVINFVISFLAAFFISKDKKELGGYFNNLIPERFREDFNFFKGEMAAGAVGFIRARFILISISTFLIVLALELFASPYSLILGLICGILDFIPVIGPGLLLIPWALYLFLVGNKVFALQIIALYLAHSILRTMLEPRVIGRNIGVHPLATLISVYLGLKIFGALGVIIGPAFVIATKAIFRTGLLANWKPFK